MNATWDRVARYLPPGLSGALSFDARPHREGNLILAGVDAHFELQVDGRFDQIINWVTEATWTIGDPDTPDRVTDLVLRTLRAGHDCRRRLIVWDGRIFWFNADEGSGTARLLVDVWDTRDWDGTLKTLDEALNRIAYGRVSNWVRRVLRFHTDHAPEKWWLNVNDEDDYVILDIRPRGGVEIAMSVEVNAPERAVLVREPGARVDKRVPFAVGPDPGELSKETEGDVRGLLLDLIAWIEK